MGERAELLHEAQRVCRKVEAAGPVVLERHVRALLRDAQCARRELSERRVSSKLLSRLYGTYNPVVDAERFVERALVMFPKGCCGVASVYLRHRIGDGRVRYGRYGTHGHTVLWVGDCLVDVTADQFGGPAVYVGCRRPPWSL